MKYPTLKYFFWEIFSPYAGYSYRLLRKCGWTKRCVKTYGLFIRFCLPRVQSGFN